MRHHVALDVDARRHFQQLHAFGAERNTARSVTYSTVWPMLARSGR